MSDAARPTLTIIAGPNGSGKSTLTRALLGTTRVPVIDPDAIARGIHPDAPEQAALEAGREALHRRQRYLAHGESFAVETTISGNAMLRLMEEARRRGYALQLVFICTDRAEINIARVQQRVAQGGHNVPAEDVRRRYERSLRNLQRAIDTARHRSGGSGNAAR